MNKWKVFFNPVNALCSSEESTGKTFKASHVYWYVFPFHLIQSAYVKWDTSRFDRSSNYVLSLKLGVFIVFPIFFCPNKTLKILHTNCWTFIKKKLNTKFKLSWWVFVDVRNILNSFLLKSLLEHEIVFMALSIMKCSL